MIIYRLAREADIPLLDELIPRSVRGLQTGFYTAAQREGALQGGIFAVDSQLIRDGTYFVAEQDGKIVGCGGWSRRQTLFGGDCSKKEVDGLLDPAQDAARVRAFFIEPGYERRGIGSEIVRRCEAALVAAGFRSAFIVATLPGEKLYERFGYSVVRRTTIPLPYHQSLPVVEMTKTFPGDPAAIP